MFVTQRIISYAYFYSYFLIMKKLLFTNWHLMRWVRLILAFGIAFHADSTENYFFLFFAFFFLIQALFDTGCGSRGCSISPTDTTNEK